MAVLNTITYYPLGDSAVVLEVAQSISEATNLLIRQVCKALDQLLLQHPAILEYVPAFTSVTLYYDPLLLSYTELLGVVNNDLHYASDRSSIEGEEKQLPVWYNGPDMEEVMHYTQLDRETVIQLHTANTYLVHMIGFVPGFPYLGGMDQRLATPRKQTPRLHIAAGSVAIGGEQTGVYPMETPGGWQVIGQTPLQLFDIKRDEPSYLAMGDRLRFVAITEAEFWTIKETQNGY